MAPPTFGAGSPCSGRRTVPTWHADRVETPEWFTQALQAPVDDEYIDVAGCSIHYRRWGRADRPGLVLVHGGGAHARWWDHVAPLLAGEYCVVALDLSGHGDSDRRDTYSYSMWGREIVEVAAHSCMPEPPIVVAHSMGGWVAITAAAEHPDSIAGLIVIDSAVVKPDPESEAAQVGEAFGRLRLYPSLDDALLHFRTVPRQPDVLPYVTAHVALTSVRAVDGGWTWKFDPEVFACGMLDPAILPRVRCRVSLFRAEHGLVTPKIGEYMYEQLGRVAPVVEVPLAWHHIMLDQPIALVTGVRAMLADWNHSVAATRPAWTDRPAS
jgi:pimeloyl-ACP methyl ester carboxylesterase